MLNYEPDVLVIGGGVIGVCTAYYAAQAGRSVCLVERGKICSGCSWGNAGWIVPSHCIPLAAPGVMGKALKWMWSSDSPFSIRPRLDWNLVRWLIDFAAACNERRVQASIPVLRELTFGSLDLYRELCGMEGMSSGYREAGTLMLFATKHGFVEGRREAELLFQNGIASQPWDRDEVLEREPSVAPGVVGGIYYPQDAQISPASFVESLAEISKRQGATILELTEVSGFRLSRGESVAVQTTQGEFRPGCVVLAAGAESPMVGRSLGMDLPIQAGKGYSFSVPSSIVSPTRPLLLSEAKVAVTPFGEKVRFAGTLELSGIDYSINPRRLNAIRESSSKFFSTKLPAPVQEQWTGLRPCTPDGLPIISRLPTVRNVIVASGHAMLGISLGPITGKLAAQLACHDPTDIDVSPLAISRFSGKKEFLPAHKKSISMSRAFEC